MSHPSPTSSPFLGGAVAPPESPLSPAVESEHRDGKKPRSRHPSPMKGRRRSYPASSLEQEFNTFKIGTVEDVDMKSPLAVLDVAKDLIEHKSSADVEYFEQVGQLPLLEPGQTIANKDIDMGFRVCDGYKVLYDIDSTSIDKHHNALYDETKVWVFVAKWPSGLSWMYWTDALFGDEKEKLTLGECAVRFGIGIFSKPNGCTTKEVFLDSRTTAENSFVIAVALDGSGQVMSRQKETNADVYRVWRSEIPQNIKESIQLRELINIRQKSDHVRWWEM